MVTYRQRTLVQKSFESLVPIADDAVALFYARLFELDPTLRHMFKEDLAPQRRKLTQMLTAAVKGLEHPEKLIPVLRDLGRRHGGYGVKDEHYDTVGAALLWTLERGLGRAFTPDVKDAWTEVYGLLSTTMKEGVASEAAAA